MKKVAFLLALIMMLSAPLPARAATPRDLGIFPRITFHGSTATCTARILADSDSDPIQATIKLWRVNTCIETWQTSGYGTVFFTETANVTKGYTYSITVDAIINGVEKPRVVVYEEYR